MIDLLAVIELPTCSDIFSGGLTLEALNDLERETFSLTYEMTPSILDPHDFILTS